MIRIGASLLIIFGIFLMVHEFFVPIQLIIADDIPALPMQTYSQIMVTHVSGIILLIVGMIILAVRIKATGVGGLIELPREDHIQCFAQPGRSNNTRILNGVLKDDNIIIAEKKLIHYKGGGFRIAGHECIRVHGNVLPNIPEKIGEWFSRVRNKYGVNNYHQMMTLYRKLKDLSSEDDLVEQLKKIPEMKDILDNEILLSEFSNMRVKDVQQMAECMWDGTTISMPMDIDEFIQTATPANVHQYAVREYQSAKNRDKFTKGEKKSDVLKVALPIAIIFFVILLIIGLIAMFGTGG